MIVLASSISLYGAAFPLCKKTERSFATLVAIVRWEGEVSTVHFLAAQTRQLEHASNLSNKGSTRSRMQTVSPWAWLVGLTFHPTCGRETEHYLLGHGSYIQ